MSNESSSFDPDDYPASDVSYRELDELINRQLNQIDAIDSKIGIMLGFTGVALSILLSSRIGSFLPFFYHPGWLDLIYFSAVVLIFASLGLNVYALQAQKYGIGPKPERLVNDYIKADPVRVKVRIANRLFVHYEYNKDIIDAKLDKFNWSLYLLTAGLGLMGIQLGYTIFSRWC